MKRHLFEPKLRNTNQPDDPTNAEVNMNEHLSQQTSLILPQSDDRRLERS